MVQGKCHWTFALHELTVTCDVSLSVQQCCERQLHSRRLDSSKQYTGPSSCLDLSFAASPLVMGLPSARDVWPVGRALPSLEPTDKKPETGRVPPTNNTHHDC